MVNEFPRVAVANQKQAGRSQIMAENNQTQQAPETTEKPARTRTARDKAKAAAPRKGATKAKAKGATKATTNGKASGPRRVSAAEPQRADHAGTRIYVAIGKGDDRFHASAVPIMRRLGWGQGHGKGGWSPAQVTHLFNELHRKGMLVDGNGDKGQLPRPSTLYAGTTQGRAGVRGTPPYITIPKAVMALFDQIRKAMPQAQAAGQKAAGTKAKASTGTKARARSRQAKNAEVAQPATEPQAAEEEQAQAAS